MSARRPVALSSGSARGALIGFAPFPFAVAGGWQVDAAGQLPAWAIATAAVMSVLFLLAAIAVVRHHLRARVLAAIALGGLFPLAGEAVLLHPALLLFLCIVWLGGVVAVDRATDPGTSRRGVRLSAGRLHALTARGAAWAGVSTWALASLAMGRVDDNPWLFGGVAASLAAPLPLLVRWLVSAARRHRVRASLVPLVLVLLVVWLAWRLSTELLAHHPLLSIANAAATSLIAIALILPGRADGDGSGGFWAPVTQHPERLLVVTFGVLCVAGTFLLALPGSSASGEPIGVWDAAFTAVSAVCVTGLAVVDTGTDLSPLGQGFLLLLIQVGGLGIMTFSTAALRIFGQRVSLRHEGVVARMSGVDDRSSLYRATLQVLGVTFAIELLGALVLFIAFLDAGTAAGPALWKALFTAISAFCNAGFALDADSLVGYAGQPMVLHTVGLLVIAGGLSPVAIVTLPRLFTRRATVPLQVKAVWASTAAFLILGFIAFLLLEWNRTLSGMGPGDALHNAWYQSVTFRTAGFNSVDLAATGPVTYLVMLALMLVGGSPGGTAGGARTTTALLLGLAVIAAVRRQREVRLFGRAISHETVYKAAAVATVMLLLVFGATAAILLTQDIPPRVAIFEVVSALATVGLSIGGTGELDEVGRVIIMACMFLGRVGALTLFMFIAQRDSAVERWERPAGTIHVV